VEEVRRGKRPLSGIEVEARVEPSTVRRTGQRDERLAQRSAAG
jgi:hypothetical protein